MDRASRELINSYYAADKELRDKAWNENNPRCRCVRPLVGRVYFRQKQCALCGGFINAHTTTAPRVHSREPNRSRDRVAHNPDGRSADPAPRLGEVA